MLGENGLGVIRKTFGVVLLAIAVKLFAANVKICLSKVFFINLHCN
jgi:small neutral amino acid transporter SnatA (MarC family)